MHFILVPFLLGVRVPANEDQWKYGPEYTFNASLGMVTHMEVDLGEPKASSLLVTMKCRPKEPVRLNCRFENARITKFLPEKFEPEASIPPSSATFSDFGFGNASFEILFKEDGIESYTFENDSRLMGDYLVNMYRLIANHLSVGIRFRKDVPSRLRKVENSTLGECSVNYNISRTKLEELASNKEYQLVWLADQKIDPEQATEISKQTNLNNCTPHWVYYFGTRHIFGFVPVASKENLISSVGRIFITSSNFTSESINKVELYNMNDNKKIGTVLDHIRVSLVSVNPAGAELTDVANPMIVGTTLKKDVH
ncbi:vitellogenin-like isoform X1 [Osmia lignaria lignaria]|uniref:vitellogenin-like isoform X1 n=2 Tax=Osmia lignaria lignaria TaxID=1437193 RepID=UPI00147866C1|nr:vitellogenin-like isoform X1 [Osmia lignaria]